MKRNAIILCMLFIIVLSGCTNTQSNAEVLSEAEARQMIKDEHVSNHGDVEIVSVCEQSDKYVIKWRIQSIAFGKDSIIKDTGKIKMVESSRGSCSWK